MKVTRDQQAMFAVEFVRTGSAVSAMQRAELHNAQYSPEDAATLLLADPEIQLAVEITQSIAKFVPLSVNRDTLIADYEAAFAAAIRDGNHRAAIAAKDSQAKLLGLIAPQAIDLRVRKDPAEMSDEELAAVIAQGEIDKPPAEQSSLSTVSGIGSLKGTETTH